MSFEPGKAVVVDDPAQLATYGRAFRKTGKRVVLVPLGTGLHAGHIALIRAAKSLLGGVVMVTYSGDEVPDDFAREGVDVVFHGDLPTDVRVVPQLHHLEDPALIARTVTRTIAAINATHATDVVVGEKDFEELVALQQAVSGLRMEVLLHSLPTVRAGNGVAMSLRNADVPEQFQDDALALSAAPAVGDARLLAAARFGDVRLIDNVGVPVGVGFKHIGEQLEP